MHSQADAEYHSITGCLQTYASFYDDTEITFYKEIKRDFIFYKGG